MFVKNQMPIANATITMKFGAPKFEYNATNKHNLILLIMDFFLKTRWMFSGQKELVNFQNNYKDIIRNFPNSIVGIEIMFLGNADLKGISSFKLTMTPKDGNTQFISKIPLFYNNISIINIGVVLLSQIIQVLSEKEIELLNQCLQDISNLILDEDNKKASLQRLIELFNISQDICLNNIHLIND